MEQLNEEQKLESKEKPSYETPAKGFNMKILLFGLPLFIIQLVAVYFITANVLLPKIQANAELVADVEQLEETDTVATVNTDLGKYVYVVEDLIINPAGTDGKRLLLSSIGFDIQTEENQKELQSKEVLVKDAIISVLGSKDMVRLGDAVYRDTLRMAIATRINQLIPSVKINNVYFSKYILQ